MSSLSALISTGFGCLGRVPSKTALAGGAPAANGVTVVSEAHKAPPASPPRAAPADAGAALDAIVSAAAEAGAAPPASPQQRGAVSPPAVPSAPLAFSPTAPAAESRPPAAAASPPPQPPPQPEAVVSPPSSQAGVTSPPGSSVGAPAASGYASLSPVMYESLQPRNRPRKEGAGSSSPAAALFLDTAPASPALSAGRRSPLRGGAARPAWAETAASPPAPALRPADVSSPPASAAVSPRAVAAGAALHSLLAPGGSEP